VCSPQPVSNSTSGEHGLRTWGRRACDHSRWMLQSQQVDGSPVSAAQRGLLSTQGTCSRPTGSCGDGFECELFGGGGAGQGMCVVLGVAAGGPSVRAPRGGCRCCSALVGLPAGLIGESLSLHMQRRVRGWMLGGKRCRGQGGSCSAGELSGLGSRLGRIRGSPTGRLAVLFPARLQSSSLAAAWSGAWAAEVAQFGAWSAGQLLSSLSGSSTAGPASSGDAPARGAGAGWRPLDPSGRVPESDLRLSWRSILQAPQWGGHTGLHRRGALD